MDMKRILYIVLSFIVVTISLTSCEELGVEIKTVKGTWKSEITDGRYVLLSINPDGTSINGTYLAYNDSCVYGSPGTWQLRNDTLCFYRQTMSEKGVSKYKVETLTMDNMTLCKNDGDKIYVMHRVYSNIGNDSFGKFEEVSKLKGGVTWLVWIILCSLIGLASFFLLISILGWLLGWLWRIIKNLYRKK